MTEARKPVSIAVFGEVLVDIFAGETNKDILGDRQFTFHGVPGGAPANVAAHLAAGGIRTSFVTSFADDPTALELRAMLSERGIDLRDAVTHPHSRTPVAMVLTKPDGDRTFRLYLTGSAMEALEPATLDMALLDGQAWFHFGGVLPAFKGPEAATRALLENARVRDIAVSFDVNIRPDIWAESDVNPKQLLRYLADVDLLKLSDEDFDWLREKVDADLSHPRDLFQYGCHLIAWTHGKDGASLLTPEETLEVPPPDVQVVDTTGAGDAFTSGLLNAFVRRGLTSRSSFRDGLNAALLKEAGEAARHAAGSILTRRGAMPPHGAV